MSDQFFTYYVMRDFFPTDHSFMYHNPGTSKLKSGWNKRTLNNKTMPRVSGRLSRDEDDSCSLSWEQRAQVRRHFTRVGRTRPITDIHEQARNGCGSRSLSLLYSASACRCGGRVRRSTVQSSHMNPSARSTSKSSTLIPSPSPSTSSSHQHNSK